MISIISALAVVAAAFVLALIDYNDEI